MALAAVAVGLAGVQAGEPVPVRRATRVYSAADAAAQSVPVQTAVERTDAEATEFDPTIARHAILRRQPGQPTEAQYVGWTYGYGQPYHYSYGPYYHAYYARPWYYRPYYQTYMYYRPYYYPYNYGSWWAPTYGASSYYGYYAPSFYYGPYYGGWYYW
jgi:hypothetical protein